VKAYHRLCITPVGNVTADRQFRCRLQVIQAPCYDTQVCCSWPLGSFDHRFVVLGFTVFPLQGMSLTKTMASFCQLASGSWSEAQMMFQQAVSEYLLHETFRRKFIRPERRKQRVEVIHLPWYILDEKIFHADFTRQKINVTNCLSPA